MAKVCFEDRTLNMFFLIIILLITGCYYVFNNMKIKYQENNNLPITNSINYESQNNYKSQSCNLKLQNSQQELIESNKKLIEVQKDLSHYKDNLNSCKLEKKSVQPQIIHTNETVNYKRLSDPLMPPERTYPYMETQMVPINIPTRGYPEQYQQYGILMKNDDSGETFALFGRREYPGSRTYEYYVTSSSKYNAVKIPIPGKKELFDGAEISVPGHSGSYKVKLYELDSPRYIPIVY